MEGRRTVNYDYLRRQRLGDRAPLEEKKERAYQELVDIRSSYTQRYPNRTFSASIKDNVPYDRLLESLECDDLEGYKEAAREQARSAVEHFKDDFIFKIRSAIREAYQRKDELNRIISRLDFGKDKYQFVITKNKGPDGKYYRMFMDDSLKINPSQLSQAMENQLNMFTMEHEDQYGEMMNELINIFIPPENATREELEEAKKNMDKYADYRTYLSFDMQQIVQGEKDMTIGLSKMIKKKLRRRGAESFVCGTARQFRPGISDQPVAQDTSESHHSAGGAGRGIFKDGCGESGKLHLAYSWVRVPGYNQRYE